MTDKRSQSIPSATASRPFLGHLFEFRKDAIGFFSKNAQRFPTLFSFKLLSKKYIVLNHPKAVQQVLTTNVKNYTRKKSYAFLQELLGMGLLTNEGEEWRSRRRLAQPSFSREKLAALAEQMDTAILTYFEKAFKENKPRSLEAELNNLTLAILTQSILYSENNIHFENVRNDLQKALEYLTSKRFSVVKLMTQLPSPRKSNGKQAIQRLKLLIGDIIAERRKSTTPHHDLLEMLMNAKDEETNKMLDDQALADEVMTMFVAGHETTASALLWTIYLLDKNPAVKKKMLVELQQLPINGKFDLDQLNQLSYLRMIILESLRLYPPVWSFGRKALAEDEIMGYTIPAGASVNIPVYCIHRHPEFWQHPDTFFPEHFLPEEIKARDKFAYLPFSQGMHRCIGEHFAIMEMQMVLARLYQKYEVNIETQELKLHPLVTLKPKEIIYFSLIKIEHES